MFGKKPLSPPVAKLKQMDPVRAAAEDAEDAAEREKGIEEMAASLTEVHGMVIDLAGLVHEQGKEIDKTKENMTSAAAYAQRGTSDIEQAHYYQETKAVLPPSEEKLKAFQAEQRAKKGFCNIM